MGPVRGKSDNEEWTWPCRVLEVIDGDTIDLVVDRGFNDRSLQRVRLLGVDTAETYGTEEESPEHKLGDEQTLFVEHWLAQAGEGKFPLTLHTYEQEGKFGRWLGDISLDGNFLTEAILEEWPEAEN